MAIERFELDTEQWAVVPRVPTEEMLRGLVGPSGYTSIRLVEAFLAMLAASPRPEAGQQKYQRPVCRGSWALGSACGKCERCEETRPQQSAQRPVPTSDQLRFASACEISGEKHQEYVRGYEAAMDAVCRARDKQPEYPPGGYPTSERLPTEADADCFGNVWARLAVADRYDLYPLRFVMSRPEAFDYWQPTGLTRPAEPDGDAQ